MLSGSGIKVSSPNSAYGMQGRSAVAAAILLALLSCSPETDRAAVQPPKTAPIIVRTKPRVISQEEQNRLGFPADIIEQVEAAAEARAEPFFEDVLMRSANLKGDVMIATAKLSGISVHTRSADEVIEKLLKPFRSRGFLVFRSEQNYGSVPDVVTVVRGFNSYDILRVQRTEAPHYNLDTVSIIRWLRQQQRQGTFVITGAGADWIEARFIRPPRNMRSFASRLASFSPDVLREGNLTVERLAAKMLAMNGFRMQWD
jgi:hypothetical protein